MILMNDFRAEPAELVQAEIEAVSAVLKSGWYVLGKEVRQFEMMWAALCGVRHAVGVGNGMDAIEIGLRACNIGAGDEVITTPMTAFATVLAIIRAGATPVLADIDPETALLDPASVERCISPRTKAVLLVHLYGQVRDLDRWRALCAQNKIELLEDCAQAHMAKWNGKVAGSYGLWGAYSFYPTKNLGTTGDGGAMISDSSEITERARILRNYGQQERYRHTELGLNSRLDEIHAAILVARLQWLESFTARRREIARAYIDEIGNPRVRMLGKPLDDENHVYHLFVVLCAERDRFSAYLKLNGIECLIHYPIPVHLQEPCVNLARDPNGLAFSEAHASQCISIPCHPQMSQAHVNRVVKAINEFT